MNRIIRILTVVLLAYIITGCVEKPCFEEDTAMLEFGLYNFKDKSFTDTTLSKVIVRIDPYWDTVSNLSNNVQVFLPYESTQANLIFGTEDLVYYDCDSCDSVIMVDGVPDTLELPCNCIEITNTKKYDSVRKAGWIYDTIRFTYTDTVQFISHECGFANFFRINTASYTKNAIDTVLFTDSLVTNVYHENIRIAF